MHAIICMQKHLQLAAPSAPGRGSTAARAPAGGAGGFAKSGEKPPGTLSGGAQWGLVLNGLF